jgi:hypothetical protein
MVSVVINGNLKMSNFITVDYTTYSTTLSALQALRDIPHVVSLDFEVQSIYTNAEREEAKLLLKEELDRPTERLCKLVANSSGLSHPTITKITHMIVGLDEATAIVIIISNIQMEVAMLEWVVTSDHHFICHNASYDLKQVYVKTDRLPQKFDDTQLLAKTYINHCDVWRANTGLKELMAQYYDPRWINILGYDNEDLKNEAFLRYSAIDAAATMLLWKQLQEEKEN